MCPGVLALLLSYSCDLFPNSSVGQIREKKRGGSPGGPVVKNLPSSTGDAGSIPGQGAKIPHAAGQLSLCATATEPARSRACAPQLERSPCAAAKIPPTATKTRCGQINK